MKKPADEVPDIDSDSPLLCESEDLNIDIEDAVSARKGPVSVRSGPRRFPSSHRKRSGFPYYQSPVCLATYSGLCLQQRVSEAVSKMPKLQVLYASCFGTSSQSFENGSKVNDENYEENRCEGLEHEDLRTDVSVMHEAIQDAVTGAFQDAVQEVNEHVLPSGKSSDANLLCCSIPVHNRLSTCLA